MNKKTILMALSGLLILSFSFQSCYYDEIVPEDIVITEPVSFAGDLIPIFENSCNSTSCHGDGGVAPILTEAVAYDELINGGYINVDDPANSELYQWMLGNRGIAMPTSGPNANYNALVLAWIEQGAENN